MIFDNLSANELEAISSYVDQYALLPGQSSTDESAPIKTILAPWAENKSKYLLKLMGNELIVKKKIEYSYSGKEMREKIETSLIYSSNENISKFRIAWREMLDEHQSEFVEVDPQVPSILRFMIENRWALIKNQWNGATHSIKLPNSIFKIHDGTKIMRIIRKVSQAYNVPYFQDFCNAHSSVLNQKKLTGELCISIHPLDYMTMSDNECNWDSCMSWKKPGSFRQGTVEMMNSPCIVVAYLTSSKRILPIDETHSWNSKKWRELYIVSKDIITNIMGYPYENLSLSREVLAVLKELAEKNCGYTYQPQVYMRGDFYYSNSVTEDKYEFQFTTRYMYNDTGRDMLAYISDQEIVVEDADESGSVISHIKLVRDDDYGLPKSFHNVYYIHYSGPSECMRCGKIHIDLDDESELVCSSCDGSVTCSLCEDTIDPSDAFYVDDEYLCQDCYFNYISQCSACGEEHRNSTEYFVEVELLTRAFPKNLAYCSDGTKLEFKNRENLCDAPILVCHTCIRDGEFNRTMLKYGESVRCTVDEYSVPVYWVTPQMLNERGLRKFYYKCDFPKDSTHEGFLGFNSWKKAILGIKE